MKKVCLCILICLSGLVEAGGLVQNATVVSVENTKNLDVDSFVVNVSGGTGICANSLVFFPAAATGSHQEIYRRAFSIALTALSTGMKVDIHSFSDDTCDNATWLKVKK
ncbi:DUF5992 family protein [Vibrio amylolyticus]|uniref:DUF5992 family protein n=1 Tax=Vibrio amylolyticus TaxID=2847292 RepID=UPI003551A44C